MRMGLIYILKNKCNDKVYVGQTVQSMQTRFKQHTKPSVLKKRGSYKIYNAIAKYGVENFYIELLEDEIPENELGMVEIKYIENYNSYEKGYNSTRGGDSKTISKIQDVDRLLELAKSGLFYKDIAVVLSVNTATVLRTLQSIGYIRNHKVTKEFLLENMSSNTNIELAKMLSVHNMTISRAFKKFGIERGKGCNNYLNKQNQVKTNNKKCIDYPVGE